MRKLKIGFFIDTFFPMIDGVTMVVDNYAKCMCRYADVTVFAPYTGEYDFDRLPYQTVLCKSVPLIKSDYRIPLTDIDARFRESIDAAALDIVHLHSPFFVGRAGLKYAKHNGIPAVITLHTQFHYEFSRALRSEALTKLALRDTLGVFDESDELWTVNEKMAEIYISEYGGRKTPCVMRNATDMLPCADPVGCASEVNARYRIPEEDIVFLFVGRMDALKNIPMIIDALKLLKERNLFPFKMLFVGSGKDEDNFKDDVRAKGLAEDVIFCGRISDRAELAKIYARADLFLFPSLFDANSLVQIEAASQDTPTLFIRGSVTSTSVKDNVNGFLCDSSPEAFAARISDIIASPGLLEKTGAGARRDLYRTWEDAADEAYQRYLKLVENPEKTAEQTEYAKL